MALRQGWRRSLARDGLFAAADCTERLARMSKRFARWLRLPLKVARIIRSGSRAKGAKER